MKIGVTGGARLRRVRYKKMPVAGKKRSNSVNLRAGRNAAPGDRGRWPRPVGRDSVEPKHSPAPIRCSMFAYSRGSTPAPGVAGRALASSPLRGPPRSLEFFRVRISREGAGNGTRGGRAPPFQPFFVGRVPSHGVPGWMSAVGCWALNVECSVSALLLLRLLCLFAAIDLRRSGWALNLES
jgi:hypothetical protein